MKSYKVDYWRCPIEGDPIRGFRECLEDEKEDGVFINFADKGTANFPEPPRWRAKGDPRNGWLDITYDERRGGYARASIDDLEDLLKRYKKHGESLTSDFYYLDQSPEKMLVHNVVWALRYADQDGTLRRVFGEQGLTVSGIRTDVRGKAYKNV